MDSPSAAPEALSGRRVALLGGFLLLGALAFALWLLLRASPASAQSADAGTTPESSSPPPAAAPEPAPPDGSNAPAESDEFGLAPLPIDLSGLMQQPLAPVTELVPPPLQPVASDVIEALPAPVRGPIAPLVARDAPPSAIPAPPGNPPTAGSVAPDPATSPDASEVVAARERPAFRVHHSGDFLFSNAASQGDGTRAPPTGVPPAVASGSSLVSSSSDRGSGSSFWLLGVMAAGFVVILGRGRRLRREATGWLPAPWCALIERPG